MIQKKIYSSMLQRGVMTLLLLVLSVTAMWADQAIVVDITGGHNTWSLQVDGEAVTSFNASGKATVSGKNGKTAKLTLTPETGYIVTNFIIYTTHDFLSPSPTRINPGATQIDYDNSGDTYTFTMPADEANGVYIKATIINSISTSITSLSEITAPGGTYIITSDISGGSPGVSEFSGTLEAAIDPETHMPYRISGLSAPLFTTLTGTVKNLVLESVSINSGDASGNTGAIACTANGAARIYNVGILSGSVGGTANTGGLVGLLDGTARVINCYSYAKITSGTYVGGIVGNNNKTTTASSINTMVMNCMFYGDITGGSTKSPVYGGTNIANLQGGLNTFNYYAYEQLPTSHITSGKYNCALAVEEKYLNRFEFYRLLLNSNKKLAAFYVTGNVADADQMLKWVLETADRTIDNPKPYPVLKAQGYYPSIINPDFVNAPDSATVGRNKGGKLPTTRQTLSVTISGTKTDGGQSWPTGASITKGSLTLTRTDKDFDRFNYNYDKVQLPYYNDVGTGNYTGNRVVTGWKITAITAINGDPYTASNYPTTGIKDYPDHNYADRKSSNKDLYSVSKRVFSQGAYFDVPYGVTSITIEPYWGKAVYLADKNFDVVYKNDYSGKQDVSATGTQLNRDGATPTTFNGQKAETSIENALNYIKNTLGGEGETVYDNALVLMGNYHLNTVPLNGTRPFTMMSVDQDNDHEPDYSLIYHHINRSSITPIRFDFLNIPGTAQAQKPNGASLICNFTIVKTRGWFEITNTALVHSDQFEYENLADNTKTDAPLILLGGVFDQFVSTQSSEVNGKTIYIHVGGNVWIKEFGMGTHSDGSKSTPHVPVSVTGGEFPGFYLTGTYKADAALRSDNAECYISGGYFHEAAGAALEQIDGNVRWQIYNADIDNFYGGGINDDKPIKGDVTVDIYNSHVTTYCGGPKFGNMQAGKKVTTTAEGCVFGTYFGAGFGGTSLSKKKYYDNTTPAWGTTLQGYYTTDRGKYFDGITTNAKNGGGNDAQYGKKGPGVATDFDYEFFVWSSGKTGGRFFVKFAAFSLAQCNDVESKLKGCTVENNFYGGGSLGKVVGTVKSELEDCVVKGNVFGAGYSASLPTLEVRDAGFTTNPNYNSASGMFEPGVFSGTTTFTWKNATEAEVTLSNNNSGSDLITNHYIYTDIDLRTTNLGSVDGDVYLTIKGDSKIGTEGDSNTGNVYGGGEESNVTGNTQVSISGGTITENVFGGGKGKADNFTCDKAMVGVNEDGAGEEPGEDNKDKGTKVIISDGTVNGNVYGGGEVGRVEWNTQVTIGAESETGTPTINGSVFGAGAGVDTHGYSALVRGNSTVVIQANAKVLQNVYGGGERATVGRYWVKGINNIDSEGRPVAGAPTPPSSLPDGMPYQQQSGGICNVTVQGSAKIGPNEGAATTTAGHVFGAGKGDELNYYVDVESYPDTASMPRRMASYNSTSYNESNKDYWKYTDASEKYVWEYFNTKNKYLEYLQTLALVTNSEVTIDGDAQVKGSVYGGSESGFVQHITTVTIQNGTIGTDGSYGNIFGGGKGLLTFAEAGKVKENTNVIINNGAVKGNVYGGGELGDVGLITKPADYNYTWQQIDGETLNVAEYNAPSSSEHDTSKNTGICTVTISGGTIGVDVNSTANHVSGHVFGAGKGSYETWWCEKAIAYATNVSISAGTVYGNVYGGGQIGRVEDDAKVTIGEPGASGDAAPNIKGDVYGAGAGVGTHGYSALVRGNAAVTVQGTAQVGGSVYGGGEIASVGKFVVVGGLPTKPQTGGTCIVNIKDNAKIGTSGTGHNVFGACKGVTPDYNPESYKDFYSMQTFDNRPSDTPGDTWDYYFTYPENYQGQKFIKRYYKTEQDYLDFLKTLALTSNPHVTIGGTWTTVGTTETITPSGAPSVYGSVYGGGQRGVTLGAVDVNMVGGTVEEDVYGGGALADTNLGNWDMNNYEKATALNQGESIIDLYTRTGTEGSYKYTKVTDANATINSGTYYRRVPTWAHDEKSAFYKTTVDLTGGTIKGDAYGGGLGDRHTPAYVWGDVLLNLNGKMTENVSTPITTNPGCVVGRIFGCNNINGTPKGNTTVNIHATQNAERTQIANTSDVTDAKRKTVYDVKAVYGGGNLAAYEPDGGKNTTYSTNVNIYGCQLTSIQTVYGGGNAASTPATNATINGCFEIEEVFGGGNGKDDIVVNNITKPNPGANVGFYDYSAVEDIYNTKEKRTTDPETSPTFISTYVYGTGAANVNIFGGTIHRVFGGSNTKGNVRQTAVTMLDEAGGCDFCVDEAYGGGKSAPMDAEAKLLMACIPGLQAAYGGAEAADVRGNVALTITNGTFDRVFGGNNLSGTITGSITVNVKEVGCKPIKIGELYGGGNQAAYSIYGYDSDGNPKESGNSPCDDPQVNVISFTSIGNIFGGGYGTRATMVGSPTVNINVVEGKYASETVADGDAIKNGAIVKKTEQGYPAGSYPIPSHASGKIGAIDNVFGGGNAAKVIGNTTVNIGTLAKVSVGGYVVKEVEVGASVAGLFTRSGAGTVESPYTYTATEATDVAVEGTTYYEEKDEMPVIGADIRGNVYGGGNEAIVTGNASVNIGNRKE